MINKISPIGGTKRTEDIHNMEISFVWIRTKQLNSNPDPPPLSLYGRVYLIDTNRGVLMCMCTIMIIVYCARCLICIKFMGFFFCRDWQASINLDTIPGCIKVNLYQVITREN